MRHLDRAKAKVEYKRYIQAWRIENRYLQHLIHVGEAEPGTRLKKKSFQEWYHTEWKNAAKEELIRSGDVPVDLDDLEWE